MSKVLSTRNMFQKFCNLINFVIAARKRSWGKVIFSVVCVKNSVHRGGLPQSMLGYHPPDPAPLKEQTPPDQAPPQTRNPHPLDQERPLRSAWWAILSTSGRYASHWNAIFLEDKFVKILTENNFFNAITNIYCFKLLPQFATAKYLC